MRTSASRLVAPSPAPRRTSRSRSSAAARRLPTSTSVRAGSSPAANRRATAASNSVVLPVPGPPTIRSGPASCAGRAAPPRPRPARARAAGRAARARERALPSCEGCNHAAPTVPRRDSDAQAVEASTDIDRPGQPAGSGAVSVLNVHLFGPDDGRPVVALHGVTGHARRWAVLAEQLPELRLVAVDLRGHGHSPKTPPWGFEQHVADVLAVMDDHGLDRAPLIGHSFGGAIALHLARAAPGPRREAGARRPRNRPRPERRAADRDRRLRGRVLPRPGGGAGGARGAVGGRRGRAGRRGAGAEPRPGRGRPVAVPLVDARGRRRVERDGPSRDHSRRRTCRPCSCPRPRSTTSTRPGSSACGPSWVSGSSSSEMDTAHMVYLEQPAETAAAIREFLG